MVEGKRLFSRYCYHAMGVRRRGKTGKQGIRSEEKLVDFNPDSLFPARKLEVVTQVGTMKPRG